LPCAPGDGHPFLHRRTQGRAEIFLKKNSITDFFAMPQLVLASGSPRRAEILSSLGLSFQIKKSDVPELDGAHADVLTPRELVIANAARKAGATARKSDPDLAVLAADTEVYLDGRIFGKPATNDEAAEMLHTLSGKTHQVWTGLVLIKNRRVVAGYAELSLVTFKKLTRQQIHDYISTVPCLDKAGAYAVQESAEKIIAHIRGSLTNVMGLPREVISMWQKQGLL
jgi:septum formation protein